MIIHFHDWEPVAAVQRDQPVATELTSITGEYMKDVVAPKTDILFRCKKCVAVKSESISGRWTIEQIRGAK